MKHLLTSGDDHLYLWIIIAVAIGAMAGLITAIFTHHGKNNSNAPSTADGDADDLNEIETSKSRVPIFIMLVFTVLAFLICWLVEAIQHRGIL
ncbi:MAG: hypothetical protein MJZ63_08150 [Muribaculaceae bacterium]|nr:hypothetical protein [Muribaculaceae bacterium]